MRFTFADLFAGIGGFRLGMEAVGGECVYTSEWNKHAQKTYKANHEVNHPFDGDITKVDAKDIPNFDVLCGGFPCQPFSSAGARQGFQNETQGTLFFDMARIIKEKQPKCFILENVPGLVHHDGGKTLRVINRTLATELGYHVRMGIINAVHWVPQRRKRLFIVGFKNTTDFDFGQIYKPDSNLTVADILESDENVWGKYIMNGTGQAYVQRHLDKKKKGIVAVGMNCTQPGQVCATLEADYITGRRAPYVYSPGKYRFFTPLECVRIMGFPEDFIFPVSEGQQYKQLGNSVVPAVISALAGVVISNLESEKIAHRAVIDGQFILTS